MRTLYQFKITQEKHGEGGSFLYLLIYLEQKDFFFCLEQLCLTYKRKIAQGEVRKGKKYDVVCSLKYE